MKKMIVISALALVVMGSGVAGSLLYTPVSAASTGTKADIEVSDKKEQQLLAKKATLTTEESIKIALDQVAGKVDKTELEDEDGTIVYGVEITDAKGQKNDVKIDAKTGEVVKVDVGSDNEKESDKENKKDGKDNEKEDDKDTNKDESESDEE